MNRLRSLTLPEAVCLCGLALMAAGVAITADNLVSSAQNTPGAALLSRPHRLALGLWTFRLESTLTFTAGLLALWWGLGRGGRLGQWTGPATRLAGGLAVGYALVAAAVAAGATFVALRGGVGSGPSRIEFSDRQRLFTWLLQVTTAAGTGLVWTLVAMRLGERHADEAAASPAHAPEPEAEAEAAPSPPPVLPLPPLERSRPPVEAGPRRAPPPAQPVAPADASPAGRARRIFQERLAYSPRRAEAQKLIDQIEAMQRSGRNDEAEALVRRLASF